MVKGITKRVIVVKSPDRRLFDEAIFIVREDALLGPGVTGDDIIKEAQNVADSYVKNNLRGGVIRCAIMKKLTPAVCALAGALFTGLIWLLTWLVF